MQDYIKNIYLRNRQIAMEENPEGSRRDWHRLATEWTQEDIANDVGTICDQSYWKKQEQINKDFFK